MVYELFTLKCWPVVKRNESRLFKGCQYLSKSDLMYDYDISDTGQSPVYSFQMKLLK